MQAPSNHAGAVKVLLVSSQPEAQVSLRNIFDQSKWSLHRVSNCGEALTHLGGNDAAVVICERDLPDGDWKLLLKRFDSLPVPPNLIVTSKLANDKLWAEVLNLGGYDVLAQPFDAEEVYRVVCQAWHARKRRYWGPVRRNTAPGTAQAESRASA